MKYIRYLENQEQMSNLIDVCSVEIHTVIPGCPLGNFIPAWLKQTATKNPDLAFALSNETSPFPEILGRICPQDVLCEGACSLNTGHGAIAIGAIETHISEEAFDRGLRPKFSKNRKRRRKLTNYKVTRTS
eukprot:TRINITY_DN200_c0_g1_i1.p1 TRINITY_DN200_c0_g1~~TRINITY_DN200_c0_g1_i1.p1  ORF type:complete len:131 (+),score=6.34 TRINITY_DN200_c0_g1_i1:28-420(+)